MKHLRKFLAALGVVLSLAGGWVARQPLLTAATLGGIGLMMNADPALATNCNSYTYTFTNGQTADANQVNSNFNTIMTCANSNLAHNGANSDITSLSGLTTPLSIGQGGTSGTTQGTAFSAIVAPGGPMTGGLNYTKATLASASTVNIGAAAGNYIEITGTTTITAFDTVQAGTIRVLKFDASLTLTNNATSLILPGGANITTNAGDTMALVSEGSGNWRTLWYQYATANPGKQPQRTVETSGSGNYSTPAGATRLMVRLVGGGGGSGGTGTGAGNGGSGGNTTFGSLTAVGGSGSSANSAAGGNGAGGCTGGNGIVGAVGGSSSTISSSSSNPGGNGAGTAFGGAGQGAEGGQPGNAGSTNSGSGAGGTGANGSFNPTGGGQAGCYIEYVTTTPTSTIAYSVGAAGAAGTSGTGGLAGAAGGSGSIWIDAYFN